MQDMGTETDPVAAVEFLARSETRVRILEELARENRLSKDELYRRFEASRTTIKRNLDALEERGWVTGSNREYAITRAGEWVAEDFTALVETVRNSTRLGPVLAYLDAEDLDIDLREFDFEVTTPDPGNPMKAVNKHVRKIQSVETFRSLLPVTGVRAIEALHDRVTNHGAEVETVVAPAVAETFRSDPEYSDYYAELRAADGVDIYRYEGNVPYYLGLLDDGVEIGVDDDGQPAALLETEAPAVYEWAERTYEAYRADAKPLDDDQVSGV